jgi:hypothetical protein
LQIDRLIREIAGRGRNGLVYSQFWSREVSKLQFAALLATLKIGHYGQTQEDPNYHSQRVSHKTLLLKKQQSLKEQFACHTSYLLYQ